MNLRSHVLALTAFAIFAINTATANAGTYDVTMTPCISPGATNDGWDTYGANGWYGGPGGYGINCTGAGDMRFQLYNTGAPGTYLWSRFGKTRVGAPIQRITLDYIGEHIMPTSAHSAKNVYVRLCFGARAGEEYRYYGGATNGCLQGGTYLVPDIPDKITPYGTSPFTIDTPTSIQNDVSGFQIDHIGGSGTLGHFWINGITARINDTTFPATTPNNSYPINTGAWTRGTATVGASSTDVGGGVKTSNLRVLSSLDALKTINHSCNFATWNPCNLSANWNSTIDTNDLSDGTYFAYYNTIDAGNNTTTSPQFNLRIDNTKPATPIEIDTDTNGSGGWNNTNTFDTSWSNTGETTETITQSGIESVIVDVEPTDSGTQTNPAPVTVPVGGSASGITATLDSVSGVSVPAAGAWTLRLQLVDRAGNTSDVGDGSGGSADSDTPIGFDPNPPGNPNGNANGWISRDELAAGFDQEFTYNHALSSFAPICGFAASVDKNPSGTTGTTINVPGGSSVRKWRLPGTLDEDTHYVHLRAVSCNSEVSTQTNTTEAKVDRTDPTGAITGVQDGKWYPDNQQVTLTGSDVLSGMAPAGPEDPDATNGAYLSYSINHDGPADEDAPRGAQATFPVSGEGAKVLKFQPVDLAGNKAPARTVSFGIDATNPIGFIERQNPSKPTELTAPVGDVPSGISHAIFQIRPASGGEWESLPTSLTSEAPGSASSTLAKATFPDTEKPDGSYQLRILAYDLAGNELASQRHEDGSIAQVDNPMREKTSVDVKLFKALRACKAKKKNGKKVKCIVKKCPSGKKAARKSKGTCYRVLRGKVTLVGGSRTVTSEFKRGAVAAGVLAGSDGKPLANTEVALTAIEHFSGKARAIGTATTDAHGLFSVRVPAGVNRSVRATFTGSDKRRPSSTSAENLSRAKMTLKLSKKRAKTGQSVTFSGKVTPFDGVIPKGGKIVALQFYAAKKWRPAVGVAHTDARGNFKIKYRFDGARVKAKIIFRVVGPSEDGWGHTYSVSKTKVIRLNFR